MASGVITLNAGVHYVDDKIRTNSNLFVANLVYLPGVTWALADNVRIQAGREKTYQRLKREHQRPGDIIHARLDQLNDIEKKI